MVLDDHRDGKGLNVDINAIELTNVSPGAVDQKIGTKYDQRDMVRMGKRQELRRNFHFFSIWGYAVILGCTWEWGLASTIFSLTNGGTAGAIWLFLVVIFCMTFVMLSFAEMSSIAPTSGGQYHWVSEFAPRKYQRMLSYICGWFALLGWQTSLVGTSYAAAQQFLAMVALSDPTYVIQGWHGTLFTIALTMVGIFFNTVLFRKLPLMEGIIVFLHCFGFLAVIVVLWVMGPRGGVETVTTFTDNGWGNQGLSCLVGILSPLVTLGFSDSQIHLSEELYDAAYVLPRAMVYTAITNYVMGFITVSTVTFTLGNDIQAILNTKFGVPWVQIMYNATNSYGATMFFTFLVGFMLTFCVVNNATTASRQLWSFARDGGMPFSRFFAKVRPGWDIPMNAMVFTFVITVLLSLFIIGSPIAFIILTSLPSTGLTSSYFLAIFCVFWKRCRGEPLPPGRFNLGRFGIVANGIALIFMTLVFVMMFFPTMPHPPPAAMNWSVVIYVTVFIIFMTFYFVKGKKQYDGPVEYVRKDI